MMEMGQPTQETTKSQRNHFLKVPVLCKSEIKLDNSYFGVSLREIEDNYTGGNCLSKEAFEILHNFKNNVDHLLMETTSDISNTTAR